MCSKLEWTPPNKNGHGAEQIRGKWRKRACASLEADASEIAAAELRGRIEGLLEALEIARAAFYTPSVISRIRARLASLQPEVAAKREEGE